MLILIRPTQCYIIVGEKQKNTRKPLKHIYETSDLMLSLRGVSIIFGIGAAICTQVVTWCKGRRQYRHISGVSVQNFTRLGGLYDFLRPIWSLVSGLMLFHDGSNKRTASNFVQILEKVRQRPWQWLDNRSGKKACTFICNKMKLCLCFIKRHAVTTYGESEYCAAPRTYLTSSLNGEWVASLTLRQLC
jgi:hypothetical protein